MEHQVKEIMCSVLGVAAEQINETTSTKTCQEWDSLKMISLVLAIEEEFRLSLTEEEIMTMTSYAEIMRLLETKLEAG